MGKRIGVLIIIMAIGIFFASNILSNSSISALGDTVNTETNYNNFNKEKQDLLNLETENVNDIEDKIKEINEEKSVKEVVDNSGKIDFKKYYKNTIFVGDSITEFLKEENILSDTSVDAEKGRTVLKEKEEVPKLKIANPDNIIMLFGMNDILYFSNTEDFKNSYKDLISEIKKELPKTNIYIESPLPVQSQAIKAGERLTNENVKIFRNSVKEIAKEENVKYLDITSLAKDPKYFEEDGIHFKYDFYPNLLNYIRQVIDNKNK